jgi:hypothetical protein
MPLGASYRVYVPRDVCVSVKLLLLARRRFAEVAGVHIEKRAFRAFNANRNIAVPGRLVILETGMRVVVLKAMGAS